MEIRDSFLFIYSVNNNNNLNTLNVSAESILRRSVGTVRNESWKRYKGCAGNSFLF